MWRQKAGVSTGSWLQGVLAPCSPSFTLPYKAQILPMPPNWCPRPGKQPLCLRWECSFANLPGRKGEESASTAEVCEPRGCWRSCCTTQFTRCWSIPVSKVSLGGFALPKSLGRGQGNDLDCCRWVIDPLRGAWGVGEFTNYSSLRLLGEGCSQHGEARRL